MEVQPRPGVLAEWSQRLNGRFGFLQLLEGTFCLVPEQKVACKGQIHDPVLNLGREARTPQPSMSPNGDSLGDSPRSGITEDLPMKDNSENRLAWSSEVPLFDLHSQKIGQRPTQAPLASLYLSMHWEKVAAPRCRDQFTEAWNLDDLVLEATGIDLRTTSQKELEDLLRRPEMSEACNSPILFPAQKPDLQVQGTSPMPFAERPELMDKCTSSMSHISSLAEKESGLVSQQQMQLLMEEHSRQLIELQETYERQINTLLDLVKFTAMDASELENWNADGSPGVVEGDRRQDDLPHKDSEPKPKEQKPQQTKQTLKPSTSQGLLLKRQLPQDVWERMKVLNENSQRNKQRVIEKLQSKISQNLERQLSDQKRLQQSLNPSTDNTALEISLASPLTSWQKQANSAPLKSRTSEFLSGVALQVENLEPATGGESRTSLVPDRRFYVQADQSSQFSPSHPGVRLVGGRVSQDHGSRDGSSEAKEAPGVQALYRVLILLPGCG
nr:PREDICTED: uncharacterized protein LOC102347858 [Latimeria chalumnae]|eukprot:XP_014353729.1 PREDICTED: uncharacterized protein LOC102347858 [Latimeria chalumnae]